MVEKLIGYEKEIMRNDILSVQINLLNKCTSKCISCKKYTWPNDKLDIEDVKNTIYTLVEVFGLKTVVLSGGDPILYPDFLQLVEYLRYEGVLFSMITTGITRNKEIVNAMVEYPYRIHLSLDACTREDYKRIRGVDAFNIVDKNIRYISRNRKSLGKLPIRLSSTISKLNYNIVQELYDYARENGCTIKFFFVHTFDDLCMSEGEIETFYTQLKNIVTFEKVYGKISNAKELLEDRNKEVKMVDCNCYVPNISCVINANGDIYPCCRVFKDNGYYDEQVGLSYGNIVGKTTIELVNEFNNRLDQKYPICGNEECKQCGQRYQDLLQHLCKVKEEDKREVLFI